MKKILLINHKQNMLHRRKNYPKGTPFPVAENRVETMMENNPNIELYEEGKPAPEPEPEPEPDYPALEDMTKAEISNELVERGVAFDGRVKKETLVQLLAEARKIRG